MSVQQNIGIRKGETKVLLSCAQCDVDNECSAAEIKPNSAGRFLQDFVYEIACEGCDSGIRFAVIEL